MTPTARPDLATRADIDALVAAFYGTALHDPGLGPVFAASGMTLATHLPRIAAFWEVSLFGTGTYAGRPARVHRHLAAKAGLRPEHFDRWLALWRRTVDGMFAGPVAELAKATAARMAVGLARTAADASLPDPTAGRTALPLV